MSTKAPSMHVTDKFGPRHREQENKKMEKKMHNKSKALGLVALFIKINFILGGITLWQMPWVQVLFLEIPMHQIVGTTIFLVFGYMELKPYFARRAQDSVPTPKKPKAKKSDLDALSTPLIED